MKPDCTWFNDVECPYATGYQECDGCDKYETEEKHPFEEEEDRGCDKYHMNKNN